MSGDYVTSGELAKQLGLSRSTITGYATSGDLVPAFTTPGGQYRWDVADAKRQLEDIAKRRREQRP